MSLYVQVLTQFSLLLRVRTILWGGSSSLPSLSLTPEMEVEGMAFLF